MSHKAVISQPDLIRRRLGTALAASAGLAMLPRWARAHEQLDDVSQLNATEVERVVPVDIRETVSRALEEATRNGRRIAMAGARHSQGGQIASEHGLTLDFRNYRRILQLDPTARTITVQPGATWEDVQVAANPYGLAVAVQQSSNIFTVGGSVAVNCHGRDPRFGCLVDSVRRISLMTADGRVVQTSAIENPELFAATVGGYGLTGVMLEIELDLTEDVWLDKEVFEATPEHYIDWVDQHVFTGKAPIPGLQLHYARPSIQSSDLLERFIVVNYQQAKNTQKSDAPRAELLPEKHIGLNHALMTLSRGSAFGKSVRWHLQEWLGDHPGSTEHVSRNNAMRPEVKFLKYESTTDTDILQEYFVPVKHFISFLSSLKRIIRQQGVNLLSATLRTVSVDTTTLLNYARGDMIAIVLYMNVPRSEEGQTASASWTRKIVDAALALGGTYYLPYQRWPSPEQFDACYPGAQRLMSVKQTWDPGRLFGNRWAATYLERD